MLSLLLLATTANAVPRLTIDGQCPGRMTVSATDVTPAGGLAVVTATEMGTLTVPGGSCAGTDLDLGQEFKIRATPTANQVGLWTAYPDIPPHICNQYLQVLDFNTCATTNVVKIVGEQCNGLDDDLDGAVDEAVLCDYTIFWRDPANGDAEVAPCADDNVTIRLDGEVILDDSDGWTDCLVHPPITVQAMPGMRLTLEACDQILVDRFMSEVWIRREATGQEVMLSPGYPLEPSGVEQCPTPFFTLDVGIPSLFE